MAAALEGFFWPKVFWDFLTKNLDGAVKPVPVLQIINLLLGIFGLAYEWPLKFIAGSALHRSIEARLVIFPLSALACALLYQATDPALYYVIGIGVYFWAYSEGEVRTLSLFCLNIADLRLDRLSGTMDSTEERCERTKGLIQFRAVYPVLGVRMKITVLFRA